MRDKRKNNQNGDGLLANFRYQKKWKRATSVLSIFVAVGTISALMLPAITLNNYICGQDEHSHGTDCYSAATEPVLTCDTDSLGLHRHTSGCYDAEGTLTCKQADFVIHTHDSGCFDSNGALVCSLKEVSEHSHDESCYQAEEIVIDEGHSHSDSCYEMVTSETPTCGMEESSGHKHGETCYATGTELICTETESSGHTHSPECNGEDGSIVCDLEESTGHTHEASCYLEAGSLMCTTPESDGHQHSEGCYGLVRGELICTEEEREPVIEQGEPVLICEKEEAILHTHKGTCFEYDAQGNAVSVLCEKREVLAHKHGEGCFAQQEVKILVCTLLEHIHTAECEPAISLTDEEQAVVDALILEIEALPNPDEVNAHLATFAESGDTAAQESYLSELAGQTAPVLARYEALTEEQKAAVTNAAKLMGLKEFLPQAPPPAGETPVYCCGLDEHAHVDSCRDKEGTLICDIPEHTHSEGCLLHPAVPLLDILMAASTAEELYDLLLAADPEFLSALTLEEVEGLYEYAQTLPFEDEDTLTDLLAVLSLLRNHAGENLVFAVPEISDIKISDSIISDGRIYVEVEPQAEYTYVWYRSSDNGGTYTEVLTNDSDRLNIDENWLNVVYDNEKFNTDGTYELLDVDGITYKVEVLLDGAKAGEAEFWVKNLYVEIKNGGFEELRIDDYSVKAWPHACFPYDTEMPYWKTTATDRRFELVTTRFFEEQGDYYAWVAYGVGTEGEKDASGQYILSELTPEDDAQAGTDTNQFVELNAYEAATLYQSILTSPGANLNWQLAHRARFRSDFRYRAFNGKIYDETEVTDEMYVVIMSDEAATELFENAEADQRLALMAMINSLGETSGQYTIGNVTYEVYISKMSSHANQWYVHSGDYTVPDGQFYTRFFFVPGDTFYDTIVRTDLHADSFTIGNLIDAVHFSAQLPKPLLNEHNLVIEYVDEVGNSMYPVYSQNLRNGESFSVSSPEITGYTLVDPNQALIAGTMGSADLKYTVVYKTDPARVTVTKSVLAEDGSSLAVTPDIPYQFQLEVSKNDEAFAPTTEFTCVSESDGSVVYPDENGIYTIRAGETVVFQGVTRYDADAPAGTLPTRVRIVEIRNHPPYAFTKTEINGKAISPDANNRIAGQIKTVTADGDLEYNITNYFQTETLVIDKELTGAGLVFLSETQTYSFTLQMEDVLGINGLISFTLQKDGEWTLDHVPVGVRYHLSEAAPVLEDVCFDIPVYTLIVGENTLTENEPVEFTSAFTNYVRSGSENMIIVTNSLIGDFVTLPATGGTGIQMYTFSGWAIVTVACALMYYSKRKQRKGAR